MGYSMAIPGYLIFLPRSNGRMMRSHCTSVNLPKETRETVVALKKSLMMNKSLLTNYEHMLIIC